jgi:hypothetical protein
MLKKFKWNILSSQIHVALGLLALGSLVSCAQAAEFVPIDTQASGAMTRQMSFQASVHVKAMVLILTVFRSP